MKKQNAISAKPLKGEHWGYMMHLVSLCLPACELSNNGSLRPWGVKIVALQESFNMHTDDCGLTSHDAGMSAPCLVCPPPPPSAPPVCSKCKDCAVDGPCSGLRPKTSYGAPSGSRLRWRTEAPAGLEDTRRQLPRRLHCF